jgi:Na+-transporting NADH:ubiquinone oxidoreductase subunit NqrE
MAVFISKFYNIDESLYPADLILFIFQAALSQLVGMSLSRVVPTFGRLVGCSLILISVCCTTYIGPEKEIEIDLDY